MRPMMLLAYDADGRVTATLDYVIAQDEAGNPLGLVDFGELEATGKLTEIWNVSNAVGSGTWPEWLGSRAHEFTVELDPSHPQRIRALRHAGRKARPAPGSRAVPASDHRRDRDAVEQEISRRISAARGAPADIRDLVGGPERPLKLDDEGRTLRREPAAPLRLPLTDLRGQGTPDQTPPKKAEAAADRGGATS